MGPSSQLVVDSMLPRYSAAAVGILRVLEVVFFRRGRNGHFFHVIWIWSRLRDSSPSCRLLFPLDGLVVRVIHIEYI